MQVLPLTDVLAEAMSLPGSETFFSSLWTLSTLDSPGHSYGVKLRVWVSMGWIVRLRNRRQRCVRNRIWSFWGAVNCFQSIV